MLQCQDLASKVASRNCREFSGRGLLGWARATLQLRLLELEREKTGKAILSVEPMGGQVCLVLCICSSFAAFKSGCKP